MQRHSPPGGSPARAIAGKLIDKDAGGAVCGADRVWATLPDIAVVQAYDLLAVDDRLSDNVVDIGQ